MTEALEQDDNSLFTQVGKKIRWRLDDVLELTKDLRPNCLGCIVLKNEISKSSSKRVQDILGDVTVSCPIESVYMGAVVRACTVDQRLHQQALEISSRVIA